MHNAVKFYQYSDKCFQLQLMRWNGIKPYIIFLFSELKYLNIISNEII